SKQRVMVTGAGGSIGKELVSQMLDYHPEQLLCLDQSEMAIFDLNFTVLNNSTDEGRISVKVLDITDEESLRHCFETFKPTLIFHAAAHKHVNLMEDQPDEALRNNYFASVQLMRLSKEFSVDRFILISTDKAINPTSVMGVTKRMAELAMQKIQADPGNKTQFMAVRFGNVLGSSGSVITIFKEQIAQGGPVTVTDPEVTRFFMTVSEAVSLVLESATKGTGGEIFVLDMGKAIKVLELARQLISLSGLKEGEDIDIEFTGLKPGEKLYEEVQHFDEVHMKTDHKQIFRFSAHGLIEDDLDRISSQLMTAIKSHDAKQIKETILRIVPEYNPYSID
ncbi:MAG: polysaccharide biosynthesis protein, partial [Coraliomargaritaceae bacterium]